MIQLKLGANTVDSYDLHIHFGFNKLKYGWFPKFDILNVYSYRYTLVALLYANEGIFHCIAIFSLPLMHEHSIIMYDGYKHKVPQCFWNSLAWQCIPEITLYITKWRVILHFATLSSVNSLWPNDTIWRHRFGSKSTQVMACCLTATNDYLNQCWLFTIEIQCHSYWGNFTRDVSTINHWNPFENYIFKIWLKFPRAKWVKMG